MFEKTKQYIRQDTKLPPYLPCPRYLFHMKVSSSAKLLYTLLLGRAQLSQKNGWVDDQGHVYLIYPIHQMAIDLDKGETTIKSLINELIKVDLLEKKSTGRGKPNQIYVLLKDEVRQKSEDEKKSLTNAESRYHVSRKTNGNQVGKWATSNYSSNNRNYSTYSYDEEESF